jgi:hypothetical protein
MSREDKTDHTPGPWSLDADGFGVVIDRSGFSIMTAGPNGGRSAYANAVLMAAAPALLAALVALVDAVDNGPDGPSIDVMENAKAAIARADGRSK